jgi:hypothetical protein
MTRRVGRALRVPLMATPTSLNAGEALPLLLLNPPPRVVEAVDRAAIAARKQLVLSQPRSLRGAEEFRG